MASEENDDSNSYGEWLRNEREGKGLTQVALADRSGVSSITISFIETGRTKNPSPGTRQRLGAALGASLATEAADGTDAKGAESTEETEESDAKAELDSQSLRVPELGSLESFEPHLIDTVPDGPGVYVFYDISDRPIYVGRSKSVRRRVRTHQDRF